MSLKAKIEAVIYAAEEPVTPAQLVSLFSVEAGAELASRDAMQRELALGDRVPSTPGAGGAGMNDFDARDPEALNAEVLEAIEDADESATAEDEVAGVDEAAEISAAISGAETTPAAALAEKSEPDGLVRRREEREHGRRVREVLRLLVAELVRDYATSDRGLEIREIAGGFRLATKPEYHDAVRGFARTLKPPLKLSLQALETLAVVAYKQPVTAPEIAEIRGVDSGGVLGSLMGRKLVTTAGRKQVIGRPILYKTTKDFLLRFGLKDIAELPSIEEFEKMAGELTQEEIPMVDGTYGAGGAFGGGVESPGLTDIGSDQVGTREGGAPIDMPPAENVPAPGEMTEPQADGDSREALSADDVEPLDGRMAGLDPPDNEPGGDTGIDSPALDAQIQGDEGAGS